MSLAFLFMLVELIGGWKSGSLALIADAAHQAFDVAGFALQIIALKHQSATAKDYMTFGTARYEHLGALATIFLIWELTLLLMYRAICRLANLDLV